MAFPQRVLGLDGADRMDGVGTTEGAAETLYRPICPTLPWPTKSARAPAESSTGTARAMRAR
ncbi:hypothetical protein ADK86_29315 [Streptomyces sp. NRRL F-5755]|nr:hypothetical protein ADK86_29315 [Streptomyces sp. NRRL F-5755]